jgi:hypothetical protein
MIIVYYMCEWNCGNETLYFVQEIIAASSHGTCKD